MLWLLCALVQTVLGTIFLTSTRATIGFDDNDLSLSINLIDTSASLWTAQLVTKNTASELFVITSRSPCAKRSWTRSSNNNSVTLTWHGVEIPGYTVTVELEASIEKASQLFDITLAIIPSVDNGIGLWSWSITVGQIGISNSQYVAVNEGFGFLAECSTGNCKNWTGVYPQTTYQFLATYRSSQPNSGVYIAAHDANAESKFFASSVTKNSKNADVLSLAISAQPEGAGYGFKQFRSTYPIVIGVYDGDWWDASQIYRYNSQRNVLHNRNWAIPNALWTRKGPVVSRADVPKWLLQLTLWVNSHWQELDIFNITGGKPDVVRQRVLNIAKRFQTGKDGLGLHWYEWDTLGYEKGSGYTKCTSEVTCGFDTHYPVRQNFESNLKMMQDAGVRVAPYINGRIFDQATKKWKTDQAIQHMAKHPETTPTPLQLYNEQYGSKAVFAVGCPYTNYWQNTIIDVTNELRNTYHVDGIYIDQIAAAGPSHGHPLGGGDSWVSGYRKMLNGVRSVVGNSTLILTESNAEPFMDGINMYLTLVGFSGEYSGGLRIIPVFPAIYGGYVDCNSLTDIRYYISMGAVFFQDDLAKNPDVFAGKIAKQYLYGAQLGWFSLGGRDNQNPYMGMYEVLMSPKYDAEVAFLLQLSRAKTVANPWIQEGRAMRDLTFVGAQPQLVIISTPYHKSKSDDSPYYHGTEFIMSNIMSTVWMDANSSSLLITLVTPTNKAVEYHFKISTAQYGFPTNSVYEMFNLYEVFPQQHLISSSKGCCVEHKGVLGGRSVVTFVLRSN